MKRFSLKFSTCAIAAILCFATWQSHASAQSYNRSHFNNFSGLTIPKQDAKIDGKTLVVESRYITPLLLTDTATIPAQAAFSFTARIACQNNKAHHTFHAKDSDGKTISVANPTWGIAFLITDSNNYYAVTLHCNNQDDNELNNNRQLFATLSQVQNGIATTIATYSSATLADIYTGTNTLRVEYDGAEKITVSLGKNVTSQIFTHSISATTAPTKEAILVGAAAKVATESTSLIIKPNPYCALRTDWTLSSIKQHLSKSDDPYEGIWHFLDRANDESIAKPGGKYTFATIRTESGYDIIYLDGSTTLAQRWTVGMRKGTLKSTIFTDTFDLKWHDADANCYSTEDYATFVGAEILALHLPLIKAQMRFSKVPLDKL